VTEDAFSQYDAWLHPGRLGFGSLQNFEFLLAVANSQCHPLRRRKLQWAKRTAFLMIKQLEREVDRILSSAEVTK
jgi:hypothetical protein